MDLLPQSWFPGYHHLLEDGAKLLGIAGWLGYIVHICHAEIARSRAALSNAA